MPLVRSGPLVGRRMCATLAACSAVLHGLMIGASTNPALAILIVAMAVACLYCAYELWTAGSLRMWCIVAVMNLAMVAVHWSLPAHHHGRVTETSPTTNLMLIATTISVVEALIATAVLWFQTRHRSIQPAAQHD